MATWSLHLVGHESEDLIQALLQDFVTELQKAGHVLDQAVLGTDSGSTSLDVTPLEEDKAPANEPDSVNPITDPPALAEDGTVAVDTPPTLTL